MSITIGRLGSIGLGLEDTPGDAASADVYLPYTDISIRGHHEPIEIISSRASRLMDSDSTIGKKWSEGDVTIDLDVVNAGYLFKMALGNEMLETGTPNSHTFYTTVSGNTPKTATMIHSRGDTDVEQYTYVAVNELTMEIPTDGLSTLTASVMGKFPTTGASQTPTTTSGTVVTFVNADAYFGSDLTAAGSASATPLNSFSMTLANNLELIHRTGSADVSAIRTKGFRASGNYVVYFSDETDKNAHYNLNKRALLLTMTGNSNEQLRIRVPEFRLQENEVATGLDDFYVTTGDWVAEDDVDSGVRAIDIRLQNDKGSVY